MGEPMRAIKLDPTMLMGFKIVGSDDQRALLTSGVLHSAKIGDKGWGAIDAESPETQRAHETARA
jgi:hypothetical protein